MEILVQSALKIFRMQTFIEKVTTELGDVVVHAIAYPNRSIFLWVTFSEGPVFGDFHFAVQTEFSSIPAVSTRLGDAESTGRSVAIRLSKKLGVPVIVSWNLPEDFSSETQVSVESRVFSILKSRSSPSVIAA